jgi:dTDP-4-amino-4,6-dideoxygalactose transaminase
MAMTDGHRIPVMRPQLPGADELIPYLRRMDQARWYSNHGPLLNELSQKLAGHFGVTTDQIALVANGTVALSAALVALNAKPGSICLLPSWTFVGSASAVWAANLTPHFVDVSEETWMLDPQRILARKDLHNVGAVMVVSAFGSPVDTAAWDAFTEETGIPVLIDCAASFDTVAQVTSARPGRSPIMISLHATKAFGIGEGGLVLSRNADFIAKLNQVCNFGVWHSAIGQVLGYNGKLNEYNAAVGLAMYDQWPARREHYVDLTARYRAALESMSEVQLVPGYGNGWVSCYCNIQTSAAAEGVTERLFARGVETRKWWRDGVHVQKAYERFPSDPLPMTEQLASRVFGLPFYHDLSEADFSAVVEALVESRSQ